MKKKIFSLLLAVCVMFTFMPTMAFADSSTPETDVTISVDKSEAAVGDTVTVSVHIPAFEGVGAMNMFYSVDDAVFAAEDFGNGSCTFGHLTGLRNLNTNEHKMSYDLSSTDNKNTEAQDLKVEFTVKEGATTGTQYNFTLDTTNSFVADTDGTDYKSTFNGTVTASVTIVDKPQATDQTVKIAGDATRTVEYGDTIDPIDISVESNNAAITDFGKLTAESDDPAVVMAEINAENKLVLTTEKADESKEVTVTVKAAAVQDKYNEGTATLKVKVNRKAITVADADFKGLAKDQKWTGAAVEPTFTIDGLAKDTDYTVEYGSNTEEGTATITLKDVASSNYKVSGSTTFTISKDAIPADVLSTIKGYTGIYDGTEHAAVEGLPEGYTFAYKVKDADDSTYTADMPKVKDVADTKEYTVKVSKEGYKDATVGVEAKVTAKDMSSAVITLAEAPVYSGTEQAIDFTVGQVDGLTLTDADYNVTGNKATNVESTTLTLTGKGNFTGTATTSWTLKQATPTAADFELPATGEFTYSGSAVALSQLKVKDGITGMGDTTIYIKDAEGNDATEIKNVGTYTITFDVANGTNYSAATDLEIGTITITAKQLTITATAADRAYEAGKTEVDVTLALTGIVDGDEVALAETAVKGTMADANVGTDKAVTVTAAPELTGAAAGNYTLDITIPAVTVNITAVNYAGTTAHTEKANAGAKVSCDLAKDFALPAGETFTFGEIVVADADSIFDSAAAPALADGKVTFTINKSAAVGKTATITIPVTSTNYNAFDLVITAEVTKKTSSGGGGGGSYIPVQKPTVVADSNEGKVDLSSDGSTATITPKDGFEIDKVTVNGTDKGAVDKVTGLKTGDKLEVTFKAKDTFDVAKYVADLKLVARSSKTAKGNVKVTVTSVTDLDGKVVDLSELTAKGYKVQYKFYRSEKKASKYAAKLTKDLTDNSYVNTQGTKGTKYFYKVRVLVFNGDELVAQTELKQCKYASRTWSK